MEEPDEAYMDEEEDIEAATASSKPINQRKTNTGNIKVAPEDSVAPVDREDVREEVRMTTN
jgi:complement component 1 Q subcomponent-binding protein